MKARAKPGTPAGRFVGSSFVGASGTWSWRETGRHNWSDVGQRAFPR